MIVRTDKLTPEQRSVIETLLGRRLDVDREDVSLDTTERLGGILPSTMTPEERQKAWDGLFAHLDEMAAHRDPDVSKEEEDEIILEALRSTRPNYRPVD